MLLNENYYKIKISELENENRDLREENDYLKRLTRKAIRVKYCETVDEELELKREVEKATIGVIEEE